MKKKIFLTILALVCFFITFVWGYIHANKQNTDPHFHANFAMYINGEKQDFSGDAYMQDVAGCSISWEIMPQDRVHLHENNGDTIHIHAHGVSWWHFFANNNFYFDSERIVSDSKQEFKISENNSISFILNGKTINNPYNRSISSQDRLLIAYWDYSGAELQNLFEKVSSDAGEYNQSYDPGSCSWKQQNTILEILREIFSLSHEH